MHVHEDEAKVETHHFAGYYKSNNRQEDWPLPQAKDSNKRVFSSWMAVPFATNSLYWEQEQVSVNATTWNWTKEDNVGPIPNALGFLLNATVYKDLVTCLSV